MLLSKYKTIVFDCDGVILNSNTIKTRAFYKVAKPYGEKNAAALVDYHVLNGGISRNIKFEHFIKNILGERISNDFLNTLLQKFGHEVKEELLQCEITPGLKALREATPYARWMLLSGGNQTELRLIFTERNISYLFDAGIYGSPDSKEFILSKIINEDTLFFPALYIGDSRYDHEIASASGLDFIFISKWTDFKNYESYCHQYQLPFVSQVADLLNL